MFWHDWTHRGNGVDLAPRVRKRTLEYLGIFHSLGKHVSQSCTCLPREDEHVFDVHVRRAPADSEGGGGGAGGAAAAVEDRKHTQGERPRFLRLK